MTNSRKFSLLACLALTAGLAGSAPRLAAAQPEFAGAGSYDGGRTGYGNAALGDAGGDASDSGYAYVSVLNGSGSLWQADGGRQSLEINQPLSAGDRLDIDRGAHAELVLPEGGVARIDGGSALSFSEVDGMDGGGQSALRLDDGSLQVVVGANGSSDGGSAIRVDTSNATAYFDRDGRYLIETDAASGFTRVVVREGSCELMTERGSRQLEAGEEAQVEGDERLSVSDAGDWAQIERWGGGLDEQARRASARYVDPSLRYSSTQLAYSGNWLSVDGQYAWRPRVESSWRPYTDGRWSSTRGGMTWISHEPWGWVTSHYGNWDYRPGSGWLWFPGTQYSPAWVYWYWGPTHVGWCPTGYYTHYYGSSYFGSGIRAGIYGWAGGWGGFLDWNFVPIGYIRSSGLNRYCRRGYDLRNELRLDGLPRGIITTDTRGAHRWSRPEDVVRDLEGRARRTRPGDLRDGLPDVSTFINRRRDLDPAVRHQISSIDGQPILGLRETRDGGAPRPEPWARQRPVERGGDSSGGPVVRDGSQPRQSGVGRDGNAGWRTPRTEGRPATGVPSGDGSGRYRLPAPRDAAPEVSQPRNSDGNAAWRRPDSQVRRRPDVSGGPVIRREGDVPPPPRLPRPSIAPRSSEIGHDGGAAWRGRSGDAPAGSSRDLPSTRYRQPAPDGPQLSDPRANTGREPAPRRTLEYRRPEPSVREMRPEPRASDRAVRDDSPPIRRIVEGVRQSPPPQAPAVERRPEPSRTSDRGEGRSSRSSRDGDRGRRDAEAHDDSGAPPPTRLN